MKSLQYSPTMGRAKSQYEISKTFRQATADDGFTPTAASGTIAVLSERGGGISLLTQAADNAIAHMTSDAKPCLIAQDKPAYFAATMQYAEAATNAANVLIGLHSGSVGSALGNDGAGPPASYSGFSFFKVDGSTLWSVEASLAGAQVTQELTAAASLDGVAHTAGSSSYQFLEILVSPKTSTTADIVFSIDDVAVYKILDWTYTSIAAMAAVGVVKAGSTTAETLKLRRFDFAQVI